MKKIITAFILLALVVSVNAQKIGVMGGVNLPSISSSDNYDYGILPGVNASLFFQKTLVPMISLRPAVGFTQYGYTGELLGSDYEVKLNYARVDADFRIKPPIIPVYLVAGVYSGYGLSGYYKVGSLSTDVTFGKNDTNPFDFGVSFGGGYVQNLALLKVFVEAKYEIGMADLEPSSSQTYKNNNIKLSLGIIFGL